MGGHCILIHLTPPCAVLLIISARVLKFCVHCCGITAMWGKVGMPCPVWQLALGSCSVAGGNERVFPLITRRLLLETSAYYISYLLHTSFHRPVSLVASFQFIVCVVVTVIWQSVLNTKQLALKWYDPPTAWALSSVMSAFYFFKHCYGWKCLICSCSSDQRGWHFRKYFPFPSYWCLYNIQESKTHISDHLRTHATFREEDIWWENRPEKWIIRIVWLTLSFVLCDMF